MPRSRRTVHAVAGAGALVVGGLVAVLVVTLLAVDRAPPRAAPLTVATEQGKVRGVVDDGVRTWRGIRYAAPPVGDLRWRPPQPAAGWDGVRDTTEPGPPCVQPARDADQRATTTQLPGSSEDCLHLDVTRPDDDRRRLPVLVWLHGGGFLAGDGSAFDPSGLAERGFVVVTPNYRLGHLGFFAHPSLPGEVANFGLLDQIAALEWVEANAAAFGGDPGSVTLAGASAGAMSVNALMVSPSSRGLFDRAMALSPLGDAGSRTLAQARAAGEQALPGLSAEELRDLPAEALLEQPFEVLWGDAPVLDAVLPEPSIVAFRHGREAAVPYLVGTTDREFDDRVFAALGEGPDRLRARVGGSDGSRLRRVYGAAWEKHVLSDLLFTAPAAGMALAHAGRAPSYRYRYAVDPGGSRHGAGVPVLFAPAEDSDTPDAEEQLARYWAAFARTGLPAPPGLAAWPAADGTAYLRVTAGGAQPRGSDPWARRLALLAEATGLVLPALRVS